MNRSERRGEDDGPSFAVLRRRLEALERDALHSPIRVLRDELGRALFMSVLRDCRDALDGELVGATARDVAEMLDTLTGVLVRGQIRGLRARGSPAG